MKAIIISDSDARALLDQLKLKAMEDGRHVMRKDYDKPASIEEIHRSFHYIVCRWLQEQGADVTR